MIGYLKGDIIEKDERFLLLAAGPVGYKVWATTDLIAKCAAGKPLSLFIHTAVKEDDIRLYGFLKKEELAFFETLLGISGVGPKTALEILSNPLSLTQNAIVNGDVAFLSKIKGLGKKTAERLVLELKGKLPSFGSLPESRQGQIPEDAILALESLGYDRAYILRQISRLPEGITQTEAVVKHVLKNAS